MKKSYDYFKTFKVLSEEISVIYQKILENEDYSSHKITFPAEKSELLNNLQNEFITPFERGDIFLLEECLSAQFESVLALQEYLGLITTKDYTELFKVTESLKQQALIFAQLKNLKGNLKLFEQCSREVKALNNNKKEIEKRVVEAVYCKSEQPLVKYILYSRILDLNRKIYKTLVETERILIING